MEPPESNDFASTEAIDTAALERIRTRVIARRVHVSPQGGTAPLPAVERDGLLYPWAADRDEANTSEDVNNLARYSDLAVGVRAHITPPTPNIPLPNLPQASASPTVLGSALNYVHRAGPTLHSDFQDDIWTAPGRTKWQGSQPPGQSDREFLIALFTACMDAFGDFRHPTLRRDVLALFLSEDHLSTSPFREPDARDTLMKKIFLDCPDEPEQVLAAFNGGRPHDPTDRRTTMSKRRMDHDIKHELYFNGVRPCPDAVYAMLDELYAAAGSALDRDALQPRIDTAFVNMLEHPDTCAIAEAADELSAPVLHPPSELLESKVRKQAKELDLAASAPRDDEKKERETLRTALSDLVRVLVDGDVRTPEDAWVGRRIRLIYGLEILQRVLSAEVEAEVQGNDGLLGRLRRIASGWLLYYGQAGAANGESDTGTRWGGKSRNYKGVRAQTQAEFALTHTFKHGTPLDDQHAVVNALAGVKERIVDGVSTHKKVADMGEAIMISIGWGHPWHLNRSIRTAPNLLIDGLSPSLLDALRLNHIPQQLVAVREYERAHPDVDPMFVGTLVREAIRAAHDLPLSSFVTHLLPNIFTGRSTRSPYQETLHVCDDIYVSDSESEGMRFRLDIMQPSPEIIENIFIEILLLDVGDARPNAFRMAAPGQKVNVAVKTGYWHGILPSAGFTFEQRSATVHQAVRLKQIRPEFANYALRLDLQALDAIGSTWETAAPAVLDYQDVKGKADHETTWGHGVRFLSDRSLANYSSEKVITCFVWVPLLLDKDSHERDVGLRSCFFLEDLNPNSRAYKVIKAFVEGVSIKNGGSVLKGNELFLRIRVWRTPGTFYFGIDEEREPFHTVHYELRHGDVAALVLDGSSGAGSRLMQTSEPAVATPDTSTQKTKAKTPAAGKAKTPAKKNKASTEKARPKQFPVATPAEGIRDVLRRLRTLDGVTLDPNAVEQSLRGSNHHLPSFIRYFTWPNPAGGTRSSWYWFFTHKVPGVEDLCICFYARVPQAVMEPAQPSDKLVDGYIVPLAENLRTHMGPGLRKGRAVMRVEGNTVYFELLDADTGVSLVENKKHPSYPNCPIPDTYGARKNGKFKLPEDSERWMDRRVKEMTGPATAPTLKLAGQKEANTTTRMNLPLYRSWVGAESLFKTWPGEQYVGRTVHETPVSGWGFCTESTPQLIPKQRNPELSVAMVRAGFVYLDGLAASIRSGQ